MSRSNLAAQLMTLTQLLSGETLSAWEVLPPFCQVGSGAIAMLLKVPPLQFLGVTALHPLGGSTEVTPLSHL